MTTVTLSPCDAHPGCLQITSSGSDRTDLNVALLAHKFVLKDQEPWLLMDCGCFFDAPVAGTPHDGCGTCFGTGKFIYLPSLHVRATREPRLQRILHESGIEVVRLDTRANPDGPARSDDDDGLDRLGLEIRVHTYTDVVLYRARTSEAADAVSELMHEGVVPFIREERDFVVDLAESGRFAAVLMRWGCWLQQTTYGVPRPLVTQWLATDEPPF